MPRPRSPSPARAGRTGQPRRRGATPRPATIRGGHDVGAARPTRRHGAGLVQHQRGCTAEVLQCAAAAYDHAQSRHPRQAGHDRHRRRQQQRTRRGHHQHRHRPHRRPAPQPRRPGDQQRQRKEPLRHPVGQPHHGRAGRGGLASQPDDARIGAVRRRCAVALISITPPALTAPLRTSSPARNSTCTALARQRGLVENRPIGGDPPVHRHHFAGADHEDVIDHHLVKGHSGHAIGGAASGRLRCPRRAGSGDPWWLAAARRSPAPVRSPA